MVLEFSETLIDFESPKITNTTVNNIEYIPIPLSPLIEEKR